MAINRISRATIKAMIKFRYGALFSPCGHHDPRNTKNGYISDRVSQMGKSPNELIYSAHLASFIGDEAVNINRVSSRIGIKR